MSCETLAYTLIFCGYDMWHYTAYSLEVLITECEWKSKVYFIRNMIDNGRVELLIDPSMELSTTAVLQLYN